MRKKRIVILKVLNNFFDKDLQCRRLKNSEFECSVDRAKTLLAHDNDLVEILEIKRVCK